MRINKYVITIKLINGIFPSYNWENYVTLNLSDQVTSHIIDMINDAVIKSMKKEGIEYENLTMKNIEIKSRDLIDIEYVINDNI